MQPGLNTIAVSETPSNIWKKRSSGVASGTTGSAPIHSQRLPIKRISLAWQLSGGIAESLAASHHFRLVQLPLNLMEPGAVLEKNQPGSDSVLEFAQHKGLGVLVKPAAECLLQQSTDSLGPSTHLRAAAQR